jgi:hypothetical protein
LEIQDQAPLVAVFVNSPDPCPVCIKGKPVFNMAAVDQNLSVLGLPKAREGFDQFRLAVAVHARNGQDLSLPDRQGKVPDLFKPPVVLEYIPLMV